MAWYYWSNESIFLKTFLRILSAFLLSSAKEVMISIKTIVNSSHNSTLQIFTNYYREFQIAISVHGFGNILVKEFKFDVFWDDLTYLWPVWGENPLCRLFLTIFSFFFKKWLIWRDIYIGVKYWKKILHKMSCYFSALNIIVFV